MHKQWILAACLLASPGCNAEVEPSTLASSVMVTTSQQIFANYSASLAQIDFTAMGKINLNTLYNKLLAQTDNRTLYVDEHAWSDVHERLLADAEAVAWLSSVYPTLSDLWQAARVRPQAQTLSGLQENIASVSQRLQLNIASPQASLPLPQASPYEPLNLVEPEPSNDVYAVSWSSSDETGYVGRSSSSSASSDGQVVPRVASSVLFADSVPSQLESEPYSTAWIEGLLRDAANGEPIQDYLIGNMLDTASWHALICYENRLAAQQKSKGLTFMPMAGLSAADAARAIEDMCKHDQ